MSILHIYIQLSLHGYTLFSTFFFWKRTGLALSDRGAGCLFGEDVTDSFLSQNKLKLIVRSHECVDDGCEVCFVLLLFLSN